MNTRTFRQTVTFKASPRQVFELLMDSKKHTSLCGEKAKIPREAGGRFTAWNGHITGFNLVVKPGEKIVQAWRATGWWPDHYSLAIFDLKRVRQGPDSNLRNWEFLRRGIAATIEAGSKRTGRP